MNWTISFKNKASKAFSRLDNTIKRRIVSLLDDIAQMENPRHQGKALTGKYKGLWRYRVGDYRLICKIQDNEVTILVLNIGHRKKIYK
jgi:mRNA interferase RelE/StbE